MKKYLYNKYFIPDEKLASKKVLKFITSADWEAKYENQ